MREDILAQGQDPALFPILNSKPELFADLLWIWEAFMVLSAARQVGMSSPQPIPVSELFAYCRYNQIYDVVDREELLHHVQKLDMVYLSDYRARNPAPPPRGRR